MRLHDIEEKLQRLSEGRWGAGTEVRAELDETSGRLRLTLPDGIELIGQGADEGALLTQAYSLLARHVERVDPWLAKDDAAAGAGEGA